MRNDIIKKIELDLGGKRVSLTPEQAKKLKSALDELFGETVKKEYTPYPYEPFRQPWRWDWDRWEKWPRTDYYMTTSGVIYNVGSNSDTLKLTL